MNLRRSFLLGNGIPEEMPANGEEQSKALK